MASKKQWKAAAKVANEAAQYWMDRYHEDTDEISGLFKQIADLTKELGEWQISQEKAQADSNFYNNACTGALKLAGDLGTDALKYALEADALEDQVKELTRDRDHYKLNYKIISAEKQEYVEKYFAEREKSDDLLKNLDAEAELAEEWEAKYYALATEKLTEKIDAAISLIEEEPFNPADTE